MTDENKCGHKICMCSKAKDSDYCSDYCADAEKADMTEIACNCNHPNCS